MANNNINIDIEVDNSNAITSSDKAHDALEVLEERASEYGVVRCSARAFRRAVRRTWRKFTR